MVFEDGPHVQIACFCDLVLQDKTNTFSLIRIVDTITFTEAGPEPPEIMPMKNLETWLVLSFKSGSARGRSEVKAVPEMPNGQAKTPLVFTVHFEGEEKGANIIAQIKMPLEYEGLYWFDIFVDEQKITRIPLRVRYNRVVIPSK